MQSPPSQAIPQAPLNQTSREQSLWSQIRIILTRVISEVSWDKEFLSHEVPAQTQQGRQIASEGDELSQTAGLLLSNISQEYESNPKFKQSAFLGLMQKLRDREVIVEGNEMVENLNPVETSTSHANNKGKAREIVQPQRSDGSGLMNVDGAGYITREVRERLGMLNGVDGPLPLWNEPMTGIKLVHVRRAKKKC